jgi:hypothetical protein
MRRGKPRSGSDVINGGFCRNVHQSQVATLSADSSTPADIPVPAALADRSARCNVGRMIIYEVTTDVPVAAVVAYESFMRDTHIPAVLSSGCFESASIARSMPGRYRVRYVARNMDVLDRYLATYAPQFRADFAAHLGSSVKVSREVWSELQHWITGPAASP